MHQYEPLASVTRKPRVLDDVFKGHSRKAVLENKKSLGFGDAPVAGRHFQEGLLDPLHLHVRCQRVEKKRPVVAHPLDFDHRTSDGAPANSDVMDRHRQDRRELASYEEQVELHGVLGLTDVFWEITQIHALLAQGGGEIGENFFGQGASIGLAPHIRQLHLRRVKAEVSSLVVLESCCFTAEVAEAAEMLAGQEAVLGPAFTLMFLQSLRVGQFATAEAGGSLLPANRLRNLQQSLVCREERFVSKCLVVDGEVPGIQVSTHANVADTCMVSLSSHSRPAADSPLPLSTEVSGELLLIGFLSGGLDRAD
jgi:hypothetical protein